MIKSTINLECFQRRKNQFSKSLKKSLKDTQIWEKFKNKKLKIKLHKVNTRSKTYEKKQSSQKLKNKSLSKSLNSLRIKSKGSQIILTVRMKMPRLENRSCLKTTKLLKKNLRNTRKILYKVTQSSIKSNVIMRPNFILLNKAQSFYKKIQINLSRRSNN